MKEKTNPSSEPHEFHWTMDGIRREVEPKPAVRPIPKGPDDDPPKDAENRRYPRIDLTVPILYKILPEEPLVASHAAPPNKSGAAGGNISPTGACLVLAEKLARGTVLALSLHGLEGGGALSAVGKVVWSKPTETAHHFLTGLEFVVVYRKSRSKTEYLHTDILKSLFGPA